MQRLRVPGRFDVIRFGAYYAFTVDASSVPSSGHGAVGVIPGVGLNGISHGSHTKTLVDRKFSSGTMTRQVVFKLMEFLWRYGRQCCRKARGGGGGGGGARRGGRAQTSECEAEVSKDVGVDGMARWAARFERTGDEDRHRVAWSDPQRRPMEHRQCGAARAALYRQMRENHMKKGGTHDEGGKGSAEREYEWKEGQHMLCLVEYMLNDGSGRRRPVEVDTVVTETFVEMILGVEHGVSGVTFHWFLRDCVPEGLLDRVLCIMFSRRERRRHCSDTQESWPMTWEPEDGEENTGSKMPESSEFVAWFSRPEEMARGSSKTKSGREEHRGKRHKTSGAKKPAASSSCGGGVGRNAVFVARATESLFSEDELSRLTYTELAATVDKRSVGVVPDVVRAVDVHDATMEERCPWRINVERWLSCEMALGSRPSNCIKQQSFRHWLENQGPEDGGGGSTMNHYYASMCRRKTRGSGRWRRPPNVFFIECDALPSGHSLDDVLRTLLRTDGFYSRIESVYPRLIACEDAASERANMSDTVGQGRLRQHEQWMDERFFERVDVDMRSVPLAYIEHAPGVSEAVVAGRVYLPAILYGVESALRATRHAEASGVLMEDGTTQTLHTCVSEHWNVTYETLCRSGRSLMRNIVDELVAFDGEEREGAKPSGARYECTVLDALSVDGRCMLEMEAGDSTQRELAHEAVLLSDDPRVRRELDTTLQRFVEEVRRRYGYFRTALRRISGGARTERLDNIVHLGCDEQRRLAEYLRQPGAPTQCYMLGYLRGRARSVWERVERVCKRAGVADHFMGVLRTMHRRDVIRSYEQFARGPSAEISVAQQVIDEYVARSGLYLARNRVRLSKLDSSMDTLSNFRALMSLHYDCVYNCAVPTLLDFLNVCALDSSRLAHDMHANVLLVGPASSHKSFLLDLVRRLRIGEPHSERSTTVEVTRETRRVWNATCGAKQNGLVRIYHDAECRQFFRLKEDEVDESAEALLRSRLDHCYMHVRPPTRKMRPNSCGGDDDEEGGAHEPELIDATQWMNRPPDARPEFMYTESIGVHMYALTQSSHRMSQSIRERMITIHMDACTRDEFSTQKRVALDRCGEGGAGGWHLDGETMKMKRDQCDRLHHFIQATKSEVENLIYIGAMQDVSMDLFSTVYLYVEQRLTKRGVPFLSSRALMHLRTLVRTLCIQDAIVREFCYSGGVFQHEDVTPEVLARLEPFLVVRMNHVAIGFGMMLPRLFPSQIQTVRKLLRLLYVEQFVSRGPRRVFMDYDRTTVSRDDMISRGVFISDPSFVDERLRPADSDLLDPRRALPCDSEQRPNDGDRMMRVGMGVARMWVPKPLVRSLRRLDSAAHEEVTRERSEDRRRRLMVGGSGGEEDVREEGEGELDRVEGVGEMDGVDGMGGVMDVDEVEGMGGMEDTMAVGAGGCGEEHREGEDDEEPDGGFFPMNRQNMTDFIRNAHHKQRPVDRLVSDIKAVRTEEKHGGLMAEFMDDGIDDVVEHVRDSHASRQLLHDCSLATLHVGRGRTMRGLSMELVRTMASRCEFHHVLSADTVMHTLGMLAETRIRARKYTLAQTIAVSELDEDNEEEWEREENRQCHYVSDGEDSRSPLGGLYKRYVRIPKNTSRERCLMERLHKVTAHEVDRKFAACLKACDIADRACDEYRAKRRKRLEEESYGERLYRPRMKQGPRYDLWWSSSSEGEEDEEEHTDDSRAERRQARRASKAAYERLQAVARDMTISAWQYDAARQECSRILSQQKKELNAMNTADSYGGFLVDNATNEVVTEEGAPPLTKRMRRTLELARDLMQAEVTLSMLREETRAMRAVQRDRSLTGDDLCVAILRERVRALERRTGEASARKAEQLRYAADIIHHHVNSAISEYLSPSGGMPRALGDRFHSPTDNVLFFDTPLVETLEGHVRVPTHWLMCDDFGGVDRLVLDALNEFCSSRYQTPLRCVWSPSMRYSALYDVVALGIMKNVAPPPGQGTTGDAPLEVPGSPDSIGDIECMEHPVPHEERQPLYVSRLNLLDDVEQLLLNATMHADTPSMQQTCVHRTALEMSARRLSMLREEPTLGTSECMPGDISADDDPSALMCLNMSAELWAQKRHNDRCLHTGQTVTQAVMALVLYGLCHVVKQSDPEATHRHRVMTPCAFSKLDNECDRSLVCSRYRVPRPLLVCESPDGFAPCSDPADERTAVDGCVEHSALVLAAMRGEPSVREAHMMSESEVDMSHEYYAQTFFGMTPVIEDRIDRCEAHTRGYTVSYPDTLTHRYKTARMLATLRHYDVESMPDELVQHADAAFATQQFVLNRATMSLHDLCVNGTGAGTTQPHSDAGVGQRGDPLLQHQSQPPDASARLAMRLSEAAESGSLAVARLQRGGGNPSGMYTSTWTPAERMAIVSRSCSSLLGRELLSDTDSQESIKSSHSEPCPPKPPQKPRKSRFAGPGRTRMRVRSGRRVPSKRRRPARGSIPRSQRASKRRMGRELALLYCTAAAPEPSRTEAEPIDVDDDVTDSGGGGLLFTSNAARYAGSDCGSDYSHSSLATSRCAIKEAPSKAMNRAARCAHPPSSQNQHEDDRWFHYFD